MIPMAKLLQLDAQKHFYSSLGGIMERWARKDQRMSPFDLVMKRFKKSERENLGHWMAEVGRDLQKKRSDITVRLRHHKGRLILIVKEKPEK